jgi:hypothetical protein
MEYENGVANFPILVALRLTDGQVVHANVHRFVRLETEALENGIGFDRFGIIRRPGGITESEQDNQGEGRNSHGWLSLNVKGKLSVSRR